MYCIRKHFSCLYGLVLCESDRVLNGFIRICRYADDEVCGYGDLMIVGDSGEKAYIFEIQYLHLFEYKLYKLLLMMVN